MPLTHGGERCLENFDVIAWFSDSLVVLAAVFIENALNEMTSLTLLCMTSFEHFVLERSLHKPLDKECTIAVRIIL